MLKKSLKTLWVLLVSVGLIFPNLYGDILTQIFYGFRFGAVSYPTSLDVFENPSGTQSVATVVTHSTQHSNANDAIEALEAKLRIDGTLTNGTQFFVSNGTNSGWSTYATGTRAWFSELGTFGNLLATGSSTIVGNFNITGNSTSTNSTSTIGAFTSLATSTNYYGAGLSTCVGANKLLWSGGQFSCAAAGAGATITTGLSTSTNSTVYISGIAMDNGDTIDIWSTCGQSNASQRATIKIRPTNWATTTYVDTGVNDGNSTAHTKYTATSTISFSAESAGCDSWNDLLYILIEP